MLKVAARILQAAPCFRFLYSIMMSRVPKAASHATMH